MTVLANDRIRPPRKIGLVDAAAPLSQSSWIPDMANLKIDRAGTHVADCHIWAEIFYLDSRTDYREYLPRNASHKDKESGNDFITLDTEATFPGTLLAVGRSIGNLLTRTEEL